MVALVTENLLLADCYSLQPNSTTLKLLMDTHAKKGMVDDCLKIYREAPKFLGRECDETLLSTAFGACCNMRCIEEAEKLLVEAESQGMPISLACYNWLILGKKSLFFSYIPSKSQNLFQIRTLSPKPSCEPQALKAEGLDAL
jgi:hypothetical protein